MIEKDDWRLLNDVEHLKNGEINPTDGEEVSTHAPHVWDRKAEKKEILSQIANKGLTKKVDEKQWGELVNAVITEMPFQPPFIIKYVTHPFMWYKDNPSIQGEDFISDVNYWGNWNGENFPSKDYYYKIEWIKVRPSYLKHRGRLIKPELIDASREFEEILDKCNIPYEIENGTYCIYGYK